jgi:hypothetical protein
MFLERLCSKLGRGWSYASRSLAQLEKPSLLVLGGNNVATTISWATWASDGLLMGNLDVHVRVAINLQSYVKRCSCWSKMSIGC